MVDIKALFEYNWFYRRKFLESFEKLPWDEVAEDRGASFGSMRNIFIHSLEAEQGWLRHLARGKMGEWPSHDYDKEFKSIESMRRYMVKVEHESRAYLSKLGNNDLDQPPGWLRTKRYRVEDLLMHVVEEEIHHRGELLCLMWQIDASPLYISYVDHVVGKHKRKKHR